ncbi:MAG: DUF3784 domain-containing protein [Oscillospiraceae bacterium]
MNSITITAIITQASAALLLFFIGLYFYKAKNVQLAVLFISGNYDKDKYDIQKICRITGIRVMCWSIPLFIGIVFDFFGYEIISLLVSMLLLIIMIAIHITDMILHLNSKYAIKEEESSDGNNTGN